MMHVHGEKAHHLLHADPPAHRMAEHATAEVIGTGVIQQPRQLATGIVPTPERGCQFDVPVGHHRHHPECRAARCW